MRLLILEDNRDDADTLVTLFRLHGHQATPVHDGEDGLLALHNDRYDGALVDLMMPDMNGWEFLERMDQGPVDHRVPVIVVSAYPDVTPPSPWHHVPVIKKPYEFRELLALVEKNFAPRG